MNHKQSSENNFSNSKAIGCGGGFMALDGVTGDPLWAQYTAHELFASSCTLDLNGDGIIDCVFGGRMASLMAIDGRTGAIIWSMSNQLSGGGQVLAETSNFYTPLPIPKDVDGDGVPELMVMHGGDPLRKRNEAVRNVARLLVVSGRTGRVITWSFVPDGAESYYSPQLLVQPDGTVLVLYGTGGETHAGGLYVVALDTLLAGRVEQGSKLIFRDCCKGVITPPVLIDITGDEILDIIISNFNTTVMAIDGLTFEAIWTRRFENGETYSTPTVGFFNDDDVPDFGVNYQFGPGFPIYHSAQFDILDGRNGRSLLKTPIEMKIGTQSSPLTISTFALNDIFLFWYSSCSNETINKNSNTTRSSDSFSDILGKGASVFQSSRMNFCKLRFGSNGQYYSQLQALTPNADPVVIYDSRRDEPKVLEQINYTAVAYNWFASNYAGNGETDTSGGQQQPQGSGDPNYLWSSSADQAFRKYKKNIPNEVNSGSIENIIEKLLQQQQQNPEEIIENNIRSRRFRRHVGLHNGDQIQRVIATGMISECCRKKLSKLFLGTLAPSLKHQHDLVDGSIDLIFATYTFPAADASKIETKMSPAMRKCYQLYMSPEKETELRLMDERSVFKKLAYDHDAYEVAVKELCAKETSDDDNNQADQMDTSTTSDLMVDNDWLKEFGSLTVHRMKVKCFEAKKDKKPKPIAIKEYRYQWWPSYLGIKGDAIVNLT